MSSKLGIQYYVFVGSGLGTIFSTTLALVYQGKTSFAETDLNELLKAPTVILIAPIAVDFITGIVMMFFATGKDSGRDVASPLGDTQPLLGAGASTLRGTISAILGFIVALIVFFLAPFVNHGFFGHILFGIFFGGGIGSAISPLSLLIQRQFD